MIRFIRLFSRSTQGVAGAEMALVTPMLIILMFGAFELGNYFWNEHIVVKSVRDAARYAGRQSFTSVDCGAGTIATSGNIQRLAAYGDLVSTTPLVSGFDPADVTVTLTCNAGFTGGIYTPLGTSGAPVVTVTATVPYNSLFGRLGFDAVSLNLRASEQAAVMGV